MLQFARGDPDDDLGDRYKFSSFIRKFQMCGSSSGRAPSSSRPAAGGVFAGAAARRIVRGIRLHAGRIGRDDRFARGSCGKTAIRCRRERQVKGMFHPLWNLAGDPVDEASDPVARRRFRYKFMALASIRTIKSDQQTARSLQKTTFAYFGQITRLSEQNMVAKNLLFPTFANTTQKHVVMKQPFRGFSVPSARTPCRCEAMGTLRPEQRPPGAERSGGGRSRKTRRTRRRI